MRARFPLLPVGLVTGWAEEEVTVEARQQSDFVIHKPFDQMQIRQALSRITPRY